MNRDDIRIAFLEHSEIGAIAYKYKKQEVGIIEVVNEIEPLSYRIEQFRVRETVRGSGIGKRLLDFVIYEIKKQGGSQLIVYPHPESYEDEKEMQIEDLYKVYIRLGFDFEDNNVDLHKLINKMVMKL